MAHLGNTIVNGALRVLGGEYVDTINGVTVGDSPKFTDHTYTAATAAPGNVASSSAQGSSANYARQDHTHGISLATGDSNGQVKIAGTNVSVKGLGTAAYTASTAYATSGHTHTLSIAADSGTSSLTMAANTKYKITAGGSSYIFTTPPDNNTQTITGVKGNAESSYRTGNVNLTCANIGAATSDHTHGISIATDSGTNQLTMSANTKYKITAGGSSYIFTTPPDNNSGGTITKVATTAGAHTTITVTSGAASFNVPTKTSHLTNDSGFLTSHQTIKQDGVTGATVNRFGTCSTAAGTAAKEVSITTGTFSLEAGATIAVKFSNANTAGTPTLNVNSKGAKNIFVNGAQITTGGNKALLTGTVIFVYDGTQWHLIGNYYDTNTQTVTGVKGNSESSYRTGNVNITAANIGAATSNHTHGLSIAADSGTAAISLSANTTYKLTAGGSTYIFKTPVDNNTTYSSKSAASGGTEVSLVTTGEKYTWNNKSNLTIGTTASTAAAGNHTHSLTIAADSGTNQLTMTANTKYKITAGGASYIFTTPVDNNTTYSSKTAASGGTDVSLVTTGEKYTWNNKSNLAIGTTASTAAAGNHTHSLTIASDSGTSALNMAANTTYKLTAGGSSFIFKTPADGNTNNAVTQTATNTNASYEVLFSATADNTTRTEGARKYSNLTFNPSTGNLSVTKVNGEAVKYSSAVSAAVGDTTCTISDSSITTTSMIEPFASNSSGDVISVDNITVTTGKAVLSFEALTEATSFKVRITNI